MHKKLLQKGLVRKTFYCHFCHQTMDVPLELCNKVMETSNELERRLKKSEESLEFLQNERKHLVSAQIQNCEVLLKNLKGSKQMLGMWK